MAINLALPSPRRMVRAVRCGIAVLYATDRDIRLLIIEWMRRLLILFAEKLAIWLMETK